uniref:Uncharacterized protein n=1 Tax=Meloidogyne floridensis TaxID=298350 RepID=A0A915NG69_9BILA
MSSIMSISNPFFDYSTTTSTTNSSQIPPFLTPPLRRAAALNDENKFKKENLNCSNTTLKQENEAFEGPCCVENPFSQDDGGGNGGGLFDR